MKAFEDLNTIVFGISRDSIASHKKFIDKYNLPFVLLSDTDGEVCKLFGVLKEKTMFGKKVMGIERSTFIVNEEGNLEKIFRKVKVEGHVDMVINHLKG